MSKKGDLSINMIVIAAIAMIILVVVSVLVFRSGGLLNQAKACTAIQGGECISSDYYRTCAEYSSDRMLQDPLIQHRTASCPDPERQMCCVPLR